MQIKDAFFIGDNGFLKKYGMGIGLPLQISNVCLTRRELGFALGATDKDC